MISERNRKLTPKMMRDLLEASRLVYDNLDQAASQFCDRHHLVTEASFTRTILTMHEAVLFAVLANDVHEEDRRTTLDSMVDSLIMQLKELESDPMQFGGKPEFDA